MKSLFSIVALGLLHCTAVAVAGDIRANCGGPDKEYTTVDLPCLLGVEKLKEADDGMIRIKLYPGELPRYQEEINQGIGTLVTDGKDTYYVTPNSEGPKIFYNISPKNPRYEGCRLDLDYFPTTTEVSMLNYSADQLWVLRAKEKNSNYEFPTPTSMGNTFETNDIMIVTADSIQPKKGSDWKIKVYDSKYKVTFYDTWLQKTTTCRISR